MARGNNRSCSHQTCYVINVTGSSAAHVMRALFHIIARFPQCVLTVLARFTMNNPISQRSPWGVCFLKRVQCFTLRAFHVQSSWRTSKFTVRTNMLTNALFLSLTLFKPPSKWITFTENTVHIWHLTLPQMSIFICSMLQTKAASLNIKGYTVSYGAFLDKG